LSKALPGEEINDTNFIFLRFVIDYLPKGLIGLLIAVIFLASWGSIAAALNSLASSTMVDFHKRYSKRPLKPEGEYKWSQAYTLIWGIFCIVGAQFATVIGNSLIEAVNILGSMFYGVMLGVFLVAFYFKRIGSNAVFWSAVIVEIYIILSAIWPWLHKTIPDLMILTPTALDIFMNGASKIGFLWLNAIGALGVVLLAMVFSLVTKRSSKNTDLKN